MGEWGGWGDIVQCNNCARKCNCGGEGGGGDSRSCRIRASPTPPQFSIFQFFFGGGTPSLQVLIRVFAGWNGGSRLLPVEKKRGIWGEHWG